ncbi:MAG: DUF4037 domain-containing protein [Cyanobacteriota bacterium]|nr:DUF4037 domain-containing protein [Cyanobacteriota bacterium]
MATDKATEHSVWRISLAHEIAPLFAASPNIEACFVFGSAALGISDQYSDLELAFIWTQLPSVEELEAVSSDIGVSDWQIEPYGEAQRAWLEQFYLLGMKVEAGHWAHSTIDDIVASVVEQYDVSQHGLLFENQTVVSHLQYGVILHGENVIQRWQAQIEQYPEQLAIAMVQKHLKFRPFDGQRILTQRLELPMLYENTCSFVRWILNILFAVNRIYHPGYKWTRHWTEVMTIKPPQLFARLEYIFQSEVTSGTKELGSLVEETLDLIQEHMPSIDLRQQRATLAQTYPRWEVSISHTQTDARTFCITPRKSKFQTETNETH